MNRPFLYYKNPIAGVFQRCRDDCPADDCDRHKWAYSIELPAGPNGKRRQVSKSGFATGKAAMQARDDVAKAHRDGTLPADTKRTLGAWLLEHLAGKIERGEIEDTTARGYRDNIENHIIPNIGHRKLGELRGLDLTRFYADIARRRREEIEAAQARNKAYGEEADRINAKRRADGKTRMVAPKRAAVPRPLSAASIARIHAVISGALKAAVPDLVSRNVAADAKLPKVEKRKVRPPEPEVYGAFLDEIEQERLYPLWVLAGYSGLRRGELAALKWEDIDLSTGRVVVRRQRVSVGYKVIERDTKSEAGQDRVVYVDADATAVLKAWRKAQLAERLAWGPAYLDSGYIITREDGQPYHPDYLTKAFARAARRCGMPGAKLHTLRHFRASALISTDADIAVISKAMGHKSIGVTNDIYGHLFEKGSKDLADRTRGQVPRRQAV